jgi:histidinol dehydrogenase
MGVCSGEFSRFGLWYNDPMRIINNDKKLASFLKTLRKRAAGVSAEIEEAVKKILSDVEKNGDRAVIKYTRRFDHHALPIKIKASEINKAAAGVERKLIRALEVSAERIYDFHKKQKEASWSFTKGGVTLGQIIRPIERAGLYVPGGKASYPSTAMMNIIPAQVAGVREIAVCVPSPAGEINPCVMAALRILGITEVYRIGGAQAIGAMAYGTKTIKRVDKIAGPGNIYVALAKKMVFGEVAIDMIAGPSEILIIADETANPEFVAADMLSQAEHDEHASSIVITTSDSILLAVSDAVRRQLGNLRRKTITNKSLIKYGAVIKAKDMDAAIDIANHIAPEHLEIMTENPEEIVKKIRNAGAAFLGQWTPEPLGDYSAGPNHTLPTGGTARFSSPLGVYDFIKRTSLLRFDEKGFLQLADMVELLADSEGLEAHANTVRIRKSGSGAAANRRFAAKGAMGREKCGRK